MDDNTMKVWLAFVTLAGSILTPIAGAAVSYLLIKARQEINSVKTDLATNTALTNRTNDIVNGQRDKMIEEIAELKKQLAAVHVVLALEKQHAPATVERVADAIEVVKKP